MATVSLGAQGSDFKIGDRLRIAPLKGRCGDVATAFD